MKFDKKRDFIHEFSRKKKCAAGKFMSTNFVRNMRLFCAIIYRNGCALKEKGCFFGSGHSDLSR